MNTVRRANRMVRKITDLYQLDFYLWGPLKSAVCDTSVNDVAEQRVEDGCELMCNTCRSSERVRQSLMWQAARYVEARRQNSEHFFIFLLLSNGIL
jgi:hypothetical protein